MECPKKSYTTLASINLNFPIDPKSANLQFVSHLLLPHKTSTKVIHHHKYNPKNALKTLSHLHHKSTRLVFHFLIPNQETVKSSPERFAPFGFAVAWSSGFQLIKSQDMD